MTLEGVRTELVDRIVVVGQGHPEWENAAPNLDCVEYPRLQLSLHPQVSRQRFGQAECCFRLYDISLDRQRTRCHGFVVLSRFLVNLKIRDLLGQPLGLAAFDQAFLDVAILAFTPCTP